MDFWGDYQWPFLACLVEKPGSVNHILLSPKSILDPLLTHTAKLPESAGEDGLAILPSIFILF